ncbi:hypothetical protein BKA80DRAFT_67777 [Phyllosticta citrichinensis]
MHSKFMYTKSQPQQTTSSVTRVTCTPRQGARGNHLHHWLLQHSSQLHSCRRHLTEPSPCLSAAPPSTPSFTTTTATTKPRDMYNHSHTRHPRREHVGGNDVAHSMKQGEPLLDARMHKTCHESGLMRPPAEETLARRNQANQEKDGEPASPLCGAVQDKTNQATPDPPPPPQKKKEEKRRRGVQPQRIRREGRGRRTWRRGEQSKVTPAHGRRWLDAEKQRAE